MILLDENNVAIGRYHRRVDTSVVMVQLGVNRKVVIVHPEALQNEQQIQMLRMEKVSLLGLDVIRICGPTPKDIFEHEGFERWTG